MSFLLAILPTLVVLGILILIHELGHFIACRLLKVRVEKFSIGFGPELFSWQGKQTRYALSVLPLGGYVKPAGETVTELGESGPKPGDYLAAPLWVRMLIVVSGVAMNYILAFFLFAAVFMIGRPIPGTTVGSFVQGYPASASALRIGDRITQVNRKPVATWYELTDALGLASESGVHLDVERKDANYGLIRVSLIVVPKTEEVKDVFGKMHKMKRLGITPNAESNVFEKYNFTEALQHAWTTEVYLTVMTHKAVFYLIMGQMSLKTLAGPVGIISITGSAAKLGLPYVLQLMATLSVSLAVINLLPIPALDGGHLVFLLIEGIRRKPVSLAVQEKFAQVGFALLMVLMVFVVYNDLVNLDVLSKIKGVWSHLANR
ncbi:MAG: RIP metalloprotease RseP [Candidatus Omnitrophica bacterium]|nr:RIP metalloprotease RseP [Candidatus Omnitrophota bacterium]